MALTQGFKPVRAVLLHRVPLSSMESAFPKGICEET